jgi:hypothetical protein
VRGTSLQSEDMAVLQQMLCITSVLVDMTLAEHAELTECPCPVSVLGNMSAEMSIITVTCLRRPHQH